MAIDTPAVGELKDRVTLEQLGQRAEDFSDDPDRWEPRTTAMARIRALTARGVLGASFVEHTINYQITIRYPRGYDVRPETWRLKLSDGRTFNIEGLYDPDNRKRWLVMMCIEGARSNVDG